MSSGAPMQQAKSAPEPKTAQHTSLSAPQGNQTRTGETPNSFADVRPQAGIQRKLQATADRSAQGRQPHACQQLAQNSARAMQLKAISAMMNAPPVQRVPEQEPLQARPAAETVQLDAAAAATATPKPNNSGLPDNLKSGIESLSGMNMDHVKVHYNSSQPAQLHAHAYAQGSEIHVAPGQEQHLPHEAWHVVQQAQGRVRPTMQMKLGVPVNDDVGLEAEADAMGAKALEQGTVQSFSTTRQESIQLRALDFRAPPAASRSPVQRAPIEDPIRKAPFYRDNKVKNLSLTLRAATDTTKDFQIRSQLQNLYWKDAAVDTYYSDPARTVEFDIAAFAQPEHFGDWMETYKEATVEQARIEGLDLSAPEKQRRKDAISMYLLQHYITNALFMGKELDHLEYQASPLNYQEKSAYMRSFATSYVKSLQATIGPLYEPNKVFLVRDASYAGVLDKFFEVARCGLVEPTLMSLQTDLASSIDKAADYVLVSDKDLSKYWEGDGNPQGFVDISKLLVGLGAVQQQVKTQEVGQAVREAFAKAVARAMVTKEGGDLDVAYRLQQDVDAKAEIEQVSADRTKASLALDELGVRGAHKKTAQANALLDDADQFPKFMAWLRSLNVPLSKKRQDFFNRVDIHNQVIGNKADAAGDLTKILDADFPKFLAAKFNPATLDQFGGDVGKFDLYNKLSPKVNRVYASANQAVVTGGVIDIPLNRSLASTVLADPPEFAKFMAWLRLQPPTALITAVLDLVLPDNAVPLNKAPAEAALADLFEKNHAAYLAATDGTVAVARPGFSQAAVMINDPDMAMAVKTTSINKSGSVPTPTDSVRKLLREKSLPEITLEILKQQSQSRSKTSSLLLDKVKQQITDFDAGAHTSLLAVGNQLELTKAVLLRFKTQFSDAVTVESLEARAAIKLIAGSKALDAGVLPDFVLQQLRQHMEDAMANVARIEDHVRSITGIHEAVILALEMDPTPVDATYAYGAPQVDNDTGKDKYFRGAHLTDYGLKAFSQVFDAAKAQVVASGRDTLDLEAFHNIYFELNDKLRTTVKSAKGGKVSLQSPSTVGAYLASERFLALDAKAQGVDVVMVDIHPNDATKKEIVSNDVNRLIDGIFGKKSAEDGFRLTLMIDITLNHPGEDEVKAIREHAEPHIASGKLNLVFLESLAKFAQLGMDKHSGGLVFAYNDDATWSEFNRSLTEAKARDTVDPTIHKYFQALFKHAQAEQIEYLEAVRANTKLMHTLLAATFAKLKIAKGAFTIAPNTDDGSCYVAIRFDDFTNEFLTPELMADYEAQHKMTVDILELGVNTLLRKTGLPVAMRESFGFPISNLGETGTEVRFTIGIESGAKLQQYADILAYMSGALATAYEARADLVPGFKDMNDPVARVQLLARLTGPVDSLATLESQLSPLRK